jgi:hypothetical protein
MKSLSILFILGALFSTQIISAQYTLTLNLQNMDDYVGHRFEVRVTELPSGKEVGRKTITSLESNSATLVLYVFLQGRSYNIDFYADVNGNESYNAPPTDHAWRRIIFNANADIVLDFSPDENYMDIGFPDAFQYSQYHAVWGGKWMNLTFGSTDSIMASFQLRCDSVFGTFTTKGVFGNPAPLTFNYAGAVPPDTASSDTIRYSVPAPWSGEVIVVNGDISGSLSLATATLVITGTLGEKQILCTYTVLVNGSFLANGYFYVRELNINSSAPLLDLSFILTEPECGGDCTGFVDLTVTGGTPPYSYSWSTGLTTEDYAFACYGLGFVTVTDVAGCSATDFFQLDQPEPVYLEILALNPLCHGICNGEIEISAFGGTPPYTFEGSGAFQDLCPGEYTFAVTDATGCSDVDSVLLVDPPPMVISSLVILQPQPGQNNGSITVQGVMGGSPPLSYNLNSGPFTIFNVFTGLPPGVFVVCVKDVNGCIVCVDSIVLEGMVAVKDLEHSISFYPNPVMDQLRIHSDIQLSVEILDLHGRIIEQDDFKLDHNLSLANVPEGTYVLKISDGERSSFKKIVKVE